MVKRDDTLMSLKLAQLRKKEKDQMLGDLAVAVSVIYLQSAYFHLYTFSFSS